MQTESRIMQAKVLLIPPLNYMYWHKENKVTAILLFNSNLNSKNFKSYKKLKTHNIIQENESKNSISHF